MGLVRTDTELLNGLEQAVANGACPGILNDDSGHWTVAEDGMQNISLDGGPFDCQTTFFVEKGSWHTSLRGAIVAYLDERDAPEHE